MNIRAIWKYYWDVTIYNILVSLFFGAISGVGYGLLIFCSFGIFIGLLGFRYFKNNEYYLYYNLGFTKYRLIKNVWFVNVMLSVFVFLILFLVG